jgi:hypothetical protein
MAEYDHLLDNGSLATVCGATNINKDIPMTTKRITEDNELFDMVTYIRTAWQL